jgi:penicillin-binding protein 1A
MQAAAEIAVRASVPDSVPYTAALVAIDNRDGSVRAVVPGSQYRRAGFDLAIQGLRQTGSAFKAITVTAALENGFSPEDRVYAGSRCTFDMGRYAKPWNVRNYDGASYGTLTLTKALAVSSNCAFARVALALGPEKIADMGRRLGITHHLEPVPSMTLGTNAVSPLDMATALSTIAADGVHHEPRFYTTVESRHGDVLIADEPTGEQVIDPQVARTATDMLTHVVTEGTGRRAGLEHPVAGKTGTNQQYRDAWFVGFTAQLTTAVWIGNPDAQVPIVINGSRVTGGLYPAQIWHDFMEAAMQGEPLVSFVPPDETLWPRAGSITERGRNVAAPRPVPIPESTTTTSAPASEEKHRRGRSERQAPPTSTASPSTTSPPTSTPATTSPTASPPDPPAADGGT